LPNVIEPVERQNALVHGGGMHWLTDASPERDVRARLGRVATRDGSQYTEPADDALGRALASPFDAFHLPLSVPVSHVTCRSPPGHFTASPAHLPLLTAIYLFFCSHLQAFSRLS
jgi:hypothetical protein